MAELADVLPTDTMVHPNARVPKTRSGKIMRRVVGAVVAEKPVGDVTTLDGETSVEEAKRAYQELKAQIAAGKS
ncbi:MAG TPA: hypothetical protein VEY12_10755 [Thermoplasmata archaeon]|nr:hypothetical protein [Thermoplasmata archaeon]